MLFVPVAHAVTTSVHLPFKPYAIATFPAIFEIIIGTIITLTRFALPFITLACSFSIVATPPSPLPIQVPNLVRSSFSRSIPAFLIASPVAATAYWQNGSILLAAFGSIYCFGSKSFTSAPILHLYSDTSNFVISPIPTLFFLMPSQNSSTLFPIGVTAPIPVTTTLFISFSFQKTIYPFSTYHINMYRRNAHCTISPAGSMLVSHYAGMYKHIPSQCSLYHLVFKTASVGLFLFQNIYFSFRISIISAIISSS